MRRRIEKKVTRPAAMPKKKIIKKIQQQQQNQNSQYTINVNTNEKSPIERNKQDEGKRKKNIIFVAYNSYKFSIHAQFSFLRSFSCMFFGGIWLVLLLLLLLGCCYLYIYVVWCAVLCSPLYSCSQRKLTAHDCLVGSRYGNNTR